jgi:hypothetical protein
MAQPGVSARSAALPKVWSKWWWVLTTTSGCGVTRRTAASSSPACSSLDSVSTTSAAPSPATSVTLTSSTG